MNHGPPNHSAIKKKGKKMKRALRFYCAISNSTAVMLSLMHCTALPQSSLLSPIHCWLNCLAQLHFSAPRLPGLPGIREPSRIPDPNTLSPGNYSAGTTPTSTSYQTISACLLYREWRTSEWIRTGETCSALATAWPWNRNDLSLASRKRE